MPDTMIEQVARVMRKRQASALDMTDHFGDWETASEGNRQEWRALARAALTAIREPTEVMKRAGLDAAGGDGSCLDAYEAMIDAALAEEG